MKKIVRRIIGKICHLFHVNVAKLFINRGKVLMLHWVGDEPLDDENEPFRISVAQCRKMLLWLQGNNVIRLEDWEHSKDFYALTIDDVPESFYHNAFPLLKKYDIPFTIFVNTTLLDTPGFVTTSQLIEMSQCELCTVGSHGVSHECFTSFDDTQAIADLQCSKEKLEGLIGKTVILYAFPYGSYYACGYIRKHLVSKFYRYGFGTVQTSITQPLIFKKYFLPRINITETTKF